MPDLTVIAGCNGVGKSTFAESLIPEGVTSFDYDWLFLKRYNALADSEFREIFARDATTAKFEREIKKSIDSQHDFCYETNFDVHPTFWAEKFKKVRFVLNLIFFWLANQSVARRRVQKRKEFKGHFTDNRTIDLKWKAGYRNVNLHFGMFDRILLLDNSFDNRIYD